jgi:hypothetical protein
MATLNIRQSNVRYSFFDYVKSKVQQYFKWIEIMIITLQVKLMTLTSACLRKVNILIVLGSLKRHFFFFFFQKMTKNIENMFS